LVNFFSFWAFFTTFLSEIKYSSNSLPNKYKIYEINPLNAELNPICHLLALLGAHHILHVSRIRVNAINKEVTNRPAVTSKKPLLPKQEQ